MAYTNTQTTVFASAANLVQAANTSLGKFYIPTGMTFTLEGVLERITTVLGGTTLAQIKIYKNATLCWTCNAHGSTDAVGTSIYTAVPPLTAGTNTFVAGDYIEIKVAVTATSTGNADILLFGSWAETSAATQAT